MSVCRWDKDSDLYVYLDHEAIVCCGCYLHPQEDDCYGESISFFKLDDYLSHLEEHKAAGHQVPDEAYGAPMPQREVEIMFSEFDYEFYAEANGASSQMWDEYVKFFQKKEWPE